MTSLTKYEHVATDATWDNMPKVWGFHWVRSDGGNPSLVKLLPSSKHKTDGRTVEVWEVSTGHGCCFDISKPPEWEWMRIGIIDIKNLPKN